MRVYTRKGDDGSTALADGSRVSKSSARVWAYGEVDELNATLGMLRAENLPAATDQCLARVQSCLFTAGAYLADPAGKVGLDEDTLRPEWIEAWIDTMERELSPLRNFILPAGTRPAALAHLARTTCRRAERHVVGLVANAEGAEVTQIVPFLNRLSDALFVLARFLNGHAGVEDTVWRGRG